MDEKLKAFERLLNIMDDLREKCPWDRKQTMESLRHLSIEEMYELSDAILEGDLEEVKKEAGDLMLHLVFYAKIASETGAFDIADVLNSTCEKLIHRHPHIYGDTKVANEEEVKANWEKLKLKEGKKSVLDGVPKSLPSLVKASRMVDKARGVGFKWKNAGEAWQKVEEELTEFKSESAHQGPADPEAEAEFGDVLFALIAYARTAGINPDDALEKTNRKFLKRFAWLEEQAAAEKKSIAELSPEKMMDLWNEIRHLDQSYKD